MRRDYKRRVGLFDDVQMVVLAEDSAYARSEGQEPLNMSNSGGKDNHRCWTGEAAET